MGKRPNRKKNAEKRERKEQQRSYTTHDTYHLEPLKPSFTEHSNAISVRRTKYMEVFVPLVMVKGRSFTHSKSIPSSGHKFVSWHLGIAWTMRKWNFHFYFFSFFCTSLSSIRSLCVWRPNNIATGLYIQTEKCCVCVCVDQKMCDFDNRVPTTIIIYPLNNNE